MFLFHGTIIYVVCIIILLFIVLRIIGNLGYFLILYSGIISCFLALALCHMRLHSMWPFLPPKKISILVKYLYSGFSQSANFCFGKRKIRTIQQRKYDLYYNSLDSIIPTTLYLVNEKILSTAVLNVDFHMKNEPRKSHVQYLYFILCH